MEARAQLPYAPAAFDVAPPRTKKNGRLEKAGGDSGDDEDSGDEDEEDDDNDGDDDD